MNTRRTLILLVLLLLGWSAAAPAQDKDKKREAQLRTVHGTAVDKDETPIPAAIVYLKNLKTAVVTTYIADEAGRYRFSGLDPNVDYKIHAEHEDSISAKRTISTFDSRKDIVIHLKVDKKKENK